MAVRPCRPLSCSPPINHAAITCDSCGAGTPICCLKVTRPSWEQYVVVKRTGYVIGDSCAGTSHTNFCGSLSASVATGSDGGNCFTGTVIAVWSNNGDCDVMFSVGFPAFWSGGVIVPARTFSGVVPSNWDGSTLTLSDHTATESITVDVCDGTEEVFPPSDPDLMLKATLYSFDGTNWAPVHVTSGTEVDFVSIARGNGTTICGISQVCEGDPPWESNYIYWYREQDTGDVRVTVVHAGGIFSTPLGIATADFPWSTTWADSGFTVAIDATHEWRVFKVADCDDPGGCTPYNCWPLCVANTCPDDPETVNASILFWNLDCGSGTGDHDGQFEYNPIGSGSFEDIYTAGDWPFTGVPTIHCDGTDIVLGDLDLFGVTWGPIVMTLECVDGEASWSHVFTDPAGGGSGGGPAETCTLTIFTNNGGGL